jgi:hypothetical protein
VNCVLAAGWALAACNRGRGLRRLQARSVDAAHAGKPTRTRGPEARFGASASGPESPLLQVPHVTVVLPVRGVRAFSSTNWASILRQNYPSKSHASCN